jgi:hypothetical protein
LVSCVVSLSFSVACFTLCEYLDWIGVVCVVKLWPTSLMQLFKHFTGRYIDCAFWKGSNNEIAQSNSLWNLKGFHDSV